MFFLDLPAQNQRQAIWRLYIEKYALDARQKMPPDDDFTGAEIKSCCRLAALLDVPLTAAAQNVVPVAKTAAESVEKLRQWASGRCLSADQASIYQRQSASTTRRKYPAILPTTRRACPRACPLSNGAPHESQQPAQLAEGLEAGELPARFTMEWYSERLAEAHEDVSERPVPTCGRVGCAVGMATYLIAPKSPR